MPITPLQMVGIMKSRKVYPIPVRKTDGTTGWVARTLEGTRASNSNLPFSSPEEAIEAAEVRISDAEARLAESRAQVIISALEKGNYSVRPKKVVVGSGPDRGEVTLFDVFDLNNVPTSIKDRSSFTQAVIDMEKL